MAVSKNTKLFLLALNDDVLVHGLAYRFSLSLCFAAFFVVVFLSLLTFFGSF